MSNIIIPESFPNLPSAIQKIQKMFAMDNINSGMLVNLLQEEPLLSANILKLVNSSHYGLSHKVTSISHAVMLLGTTIIRGIVMATALKKSFPLNLSPYKISIELFDTICIFRSRLLKEWFKDENLDIKSLSSAAFLMESGRIVMANEIIKNNLSENFIELLKNHTIIDAEKLLFYTDSYQIASKLFKQWQFDDNFTNLIQGVSDPKTDEQKILRVLSTAIGVEGILNDTNIDEAIKLLIEYKLDSTKFLEAVTNIKKEL